MAAVASWMLSTMPRLTPWAGVMPTPRMRMSLSGVTSATRVHTLLLPTSMAASMFSLIRSPPPLSLERRSVSEAKVEDAARHAFAAELVLHGFPYGKFVVNVLAIADDDAVAGVGVERKSLGDGV